MNLQEGSSQDLAPSQIRSWDPSSDPNSKGRSWEDPSQSSNSQGWGLQDKRKNAQKPGSVFFGKLYYTELRTLYSGSESVQQQLKAARQALQHPPQRAPLVQLLARVPDLSQAEVVGVMRWCLQLNPASSPDQTHSANSVLAAVSRLGLAQTFPHEIQMRPKFDKILVQVGLRYKSCCFAW